MLGSYGLINTLKRPLLLNIKCLSEKKNFTRIIVSTYLQLRPLINRVYLSLG